MKFLAQSNNTQLILRTKVWIRCVYCCLKKYINYKYTEANKTSFTSKYSWWSMIFLFIDLLHRTSTNKLINADKMFQIYWNVDFVGIGVIQFYTSILSDRDIYWYFCHLKFKRVCSWLEDRELQSKFKYCTRFFAEPTILTYTPLPVRRRNNENYNQRDARLVRCNFQRPLFLVVWFFVLTRKYGVICRKSLPPAGENLLGIWCAAVTLLRADDVIKGVET